MKRGTCLKLLEANYDGVPSIHDGHEHPGLLHTKAMLPKIDRRFLKDTVLKIRVLERVPFHFHTPVRANWVAIQGATSDM